MSLLTVIWLLNKIIYEVFVTQRNKLLFLYSKKKKKNGSKKDFIILYTHIVSESVPTVGLFSWCYSVVNTKIR